MVKEPLHPEGSLRTRWDILLLLFLLYVCFTAPVMVCFDVNLNPDQPLWWFEIVVMVFFILDVVLNFNTAYRGREAMTVHRRTYEGATLAAFTSGCAFWPLQT